MELKNGRVTGREHMGQYPDEQLIKFVKTTYGALSLAEINRTRVLDCGCGWGRNTRFCAGEMMAVSGIDRSLATLRVAAQTAAQVPPGYVNGLFDQLPYRRSTIDLVIDVLSITNNYPETIRSVIRQVRFVLKPGGHYWGKLLHCEDTYIQRQAQVAAATYRSVKAQTGIVHFFSEAEIDSLFSEFAAYEKNIIQITYSPMNLVNKIWIINARN